MPGGFAAKEAPLLGGGDIHECRLPDFARHPVDLLRVETNTRAVDLVQRIDCVSHRHEERPGAVVPIDGFGELDRALSEIGLKFGSRRIPKQTGNNGHEITPLHSISRPSHPEPRVGFGSLQPHW